MVIIKINRKLVKVVFAILLAISSGFNVYNHIQNKTLESRYNVLSCIVEQFNESRPVPFIASKSVQVYDHKDVEIFDINKGEVIRKIKINPLIQREAEKYLQTITGMYVKANAFPEEGYIIRVPLEPSVKVQSQWLNDYGINSVDELFIILPEQGMPYLLMLDNKYRPLFYNFESSTEELLNILDFQ